MEILMIHSYKGGSGKTLLSYNIAQLLARKKRRVLLIEADLDGPVFHQNFPTLSPQKYINQYLKDPKELESYIVPGDLFDLIFASPQFTVQDLLRSRDYEILLDHILDIKTQISELDYDFVVFDLSPGVNYLAVATIVLADHILLTLRPDFNSFEGTRMLINQIYANTIDNETKKFHIIINQVPELEGFETVIKEWEIALNYQFSFLNSFHSIPFDPTTSLNVLQRHLLLPGDDSFLESIKELIERIW